MSDLETVVRPGSFSVPGFGSRDHLVALVWALISAAVTFLPAVKFADADLVPGLLALASVVGYVGYIDARTKLIPDSYTVTAFAVAVAFLIQVQVTRGLVHPVLITAAITGAGAFIVMMALVILTGFGSGGDIKFVGAPAAMIAVIAPLTATIWLLIAFLLALLSTVVRLLLRPKDRSGFPMAPLMAASLPISLAVGHLVFAAAGR